jgi:DNA-directed RNA polymerase specialized sigma24 family protein
MYASTEQRSRERVQVLADRLYRERYHYLLRIAWGNGAGGDANDAVNDAFAAFLDKFDPDCGAPPLGWLTLTLKRRCWAINRGRRLERRAGHWFHPESAEPRFSVAGLPTQTAGPEESAERAEYVLEARERLAALKPDARTALLLFGLGYSYHEISERRGWSYTKTNRSITEGRAVLRKGQHAE